MEPNNDNIEHLPELEFIDTRRIRKPFEWGTIAPVRIDPGLVRFEPEEIIFGLYNDVKSGNTYLIYSTSLHLHGGSPQATDLDLIHKYQKVRDHQE